MSSSAYWLGFPLHHSCPLSTLRLSGLYLPLQREMLRPPCFLMKLPRWCELHALMGVRGYLSGPHVWHQKMAGKKSSSQSESSDYESGLSMMCILFSSLIYFNMEFNRDTKTPFDATDKTNLPTFWHNSVPGA